MSATDASIKATPPATVADLIALFDDPRLGYSPLQRALVEQCLRGGYEMGERAATMDAVERIRRIEIPVLTPEPTP